MIFLYGLATFMENRGSGIRDVWEDVSGKRIKFPIAKLARRIAVDDF